MGGVLENIQERLGLIEQALIKIAELPLNTGVSIKQTIADNEEQPKKRGRPFGSKSKEPATSEASGKSSVESSADPVKNVETTAERPTQEFEEYDPLGNEIPVDASITLDALTAKCKELRDNSDDAVAWNDNFLRVLKNAYGTDRLSALPKTEYKNFLELLEQE